MEPAAGAPETGGASGTLHFSDVILATEQEMLRKTWSSSPATLTTAATTPASSSETAT